MWNHEITLISKEVTGKDKLLQPISEDVEVTLLCRKRGSLALNFIRRIR